MVLRAQSDDSDISLMLRAKQGDSEAFELLSARYRRQLTGFFYSMCWNADTSQDWTQEVLVRLWLARDDYTPCGSFRAYVFRIARNYWLTVLRKRKSRPEPMYLDEAWQPQIDETAIEKVLIRRYEDGRIRTAISDLPEHYRLVFVLSHFQEMKYSEISEVLDIPVGTVKSRMSAAVRTLRDKLSKETED